MKWATLPEEITVKHLLGIGLLASIGFTMSLFISGLAFKDPLLISQAKIGVLIASVVASIVGFFVMRTASKNS